MSDTPRKLPKQKRARQTVQRITKAAEQLIIENGLEALSTNKIAEAANVNISSLYQYFPNKDAIVAAIVDENVKYMIDVMDTALDEMTDLPIEEVTRRWLYMAISLYRESEGLFPEMLKSISSPRPFSGADLIEKRLMEAARKFTLRRIDKVTVSDVNVAVYVGFHSALLVMSKHLMDPNSYLKDEEVVAGIAEMLARYMEGTSKC